MNKFKIWLLFYFSIASIDSVPLSNSDDDSNKRPALQRVRRVVSQQENENNANVQVETTHGDFNLTFQKSELKILSPNVMFGIIDIDSTSGEYFVEKLNFRKEDLEKHLFVDDAQDAIFELNTTGPNIKLNGILGDTSLVSDSEGTKHFSYSTTEEFDDIDYIIPDREFFSPPPIGALRTSATAEVAILIDFKKSQLTFGGDSKALLTYLAVLFHSVNNRYKAMTEPSIDIVITGAHILRSRAAQPFVENHKLPNSNEYDGRLMLREFSRWVFQNKRLLSPHDLVTLVTDESMVGANGWAYACGSCTTTSDSYLGVSVVTDTGKYWRAVRTMTHELGHSLGSIHDGAKTDTEDASRCPYTDGHIMGSQASSDTRKFFFSSCSKRLMTNCISTPDATCFQSLQSEDHWDLFNTDPGELMNMDEQCRMWQNNPTARRDPGISPDASCINLNCEFRQNGVLLTQEWSHPALDKSPCGSGQTRGRCWLGKCVRGL